MLSIKIYWNVSHTYLINLWSGIIIIKHQLELTEVTSVNYKINISVKDKIYDQKYNI